MLRLTRTIWFFAILILCAATVAEDQSDARSLYQLLSPIKGLSAQFSQQIFYPNEVPSKPSSGELAATEANKIRWIVKQPMAQHIIGDGTQLWHYEPDLEQVIIHPFIEDIAVIPIALFAGNLEELDEAYSIVYRPTENPELKSYLLTSKSTGAMYTTLQIDFAAQIPILLKLVSPDRTIIDINLKNVVINPQLSDDLFTFEIPAGVEVFDTVNKNVD